MKDNYCIINAQYEIIINKVNRYGYKCIYTEKSYNVSPPISLHADVLYLKTDNNKLSVSDCQKNNINLLKKMGYDITAIELQPGYSNECKLNIVISDNSIICNPVTCMDLTSIQHNKETIKVKQGYTKCSTIILPDDNFITEDKGIYTALKNTGKECLLIEKGHVKLEGYDYGFIGGASTYLNNDKTLLFFGNITQHPQYKNIIEFCEKSGISIDYIEEMPLTDIGGAIHFSI